MAIQSKILLFTIIIIIIIIIIIVIISLTDFSLCDDFRIKIIYKKSPPVMNLKKKNYVGRHLAAWLGRGFQTRPNKN